MFRTVLQALRLIWQNFGSGKFEFERLCFASEMGLMRFQVFSRLMLFFLQKLYEIVIYCCIEIQSTWVKKFSTVYLRLIVCGSIHFEAVYVTGFGIADVSLR